MSDPVLRYSISNIFLAYFLLLCCSLSIWMVKVNFWSKTTPGSHRNQYLQPVASIPSTINSAFALILFLPQIYWRSILFWAYSIITIFNYFTSPAFQSYVFPKLRNKRAILVVFKNTYEIIACYSAILFVNESTTSINPAAYLPINWSDPLESPPVWMGAMVHRRPLTGALENGLHLYLH